MPPGTISIFEIPLILDIICDLISPKDVWSCRRTCQVWSHSFEPYAWHHIRLSRRTARPFEATQLLQKNADKIRSLDIHIADTIFLVPSCTRLTQLTCYGGSSSSSNNHNRDLSRQDDHNSNSSRLKNSPQAGATHLIAQNPHLECLTFAMEFTALIPEYFTPSVLIGLRQSAISTLELDLRQTYDVTVLAAILFYCPDTLTELTINNTARFERTQFITELGGDNCQRIPLPPWREFPSLTRLVLRHQLKFQEEAILFPLLRHSQHLRELALPSIRMSHSDTMVTILIESCPHIDRMLRFSEHDDLTHDRCLDILWAYPSLVEFAFCYSEDMTPEVIEVLLEQSGSTLEVLEVSAGFDTDNRERIGACVSQVLQRCPRLRKLKVVHEWEIEATGVGLQEFVEIQWAASRWLEELEIPIGSPGFFSLSIDEGDVWDRVMEGQRTADERDTPGGIEQRMVNARRVLQLARRMKALPRLRNVKLLWMDPVVPIEDALELHREEGQDDEEVVDETFLRWMGLKDVGSGDDADTDYELDADDSTDTEAYTTADVEPIAVIVSAAGAGTLQISVLEPVPDLTLPGWRTLPNLKRIIVGMDDRGQPEESVLSPLLLQHSTTLCYLGILDFRAGSSPIFSIS
ncbi:hypothetical protein K457DRAFT_15974 [Linnemannia elongata AG-77]|uniref:F-box domain-containing protein n=1 Tax=Linnemannia elongata AG-77 TaxID=1314771 RepID=A0A197K6V3_9FUNG|nr:hypothetical protein K457DRAFT_15974 [Linnemannia elongata AG-77]